MPIPAILGAVTGSLLGGGGGGGSGSSNYYVPTGLSSADKAWQSLFGQGNNLATGAAGQVDPTFLAALKSLQGINYNPIATAGTQAGQIYDTLAGIAGNQAGQYGQEAQSALGQQSGMFGAGNQILQTAMDPQNALYNRTLQQLTDQVNAGQAQRGLGVSPQGAGELNNALSNFNIDWQNNQLARQAQGIQGASQANASGSQLGNLAGQNMVAQLGAGGQQAGYVQQGAQTPITAQQQAVSAPATNASQYLSWLAPVMQMLSGQAGMAIPYMNYGQGAQQNNYDNVANQNAANYQFGSEIGKAVGNSNWFQNLFSSTPQQTQSSAFQPGGLNYNAPSNNFDWLTSISP